jgi:hypothetical protein
MIIIHACKLVGGAPAQDQYTMKETGEQIKEDSFILSLSGKKKEATILEILRNNEESVLEINTITLDGYLVFRDNKSLKREWIGKWTEVEKSYKGDKTIIGNKYFSCLKDEV